MVSWRDLPPCYGNWNSIYRKFRQWCESGLFEPLLHLVNVDAAHLTLLGIDLTFCKVHWSACCALKNQAIFSAHQELSPHRYSL